MNGPSRPRPRATALAFALLATLLSLLVARPAAAGGGTFRLGSTSVSEVSGGWHIYCDVTLPKAPPIPHVTLKFLLTKTAVFERSLVDNNPNPVTNRTSLVNQNPSVESLEVDFADARGQIWKGTHFDFSLTRVRGYESGEYKFQVRTSDGVDIGTPTTLTLKGDNPVVDRRAMNFDAKNPGIKKVDTGEHPNGPAKVDDTAAAAPTNGDVVPAGTAPPFLSEDAFKKQPEEIHEHPKGCGCDVPGRGAAGVSEGTRALAALWTGLGLSVLVWRRRRAPRPDAQG